MGYRIFGLIFSTVFTLGSGLIGYALTDIYLSFPFIRDQRVGDQALYSYRPLVAIAFIVLGGLLGFLVGSVLFRHIAQIGKNLKTIPAEDKIAFCIGTVVSLVPALMLATAILPLPFNSAVLFAIILIEAVLVVWLGNVIAISMKDEIKFFLASGNHRDGQSAAVDPNLGVTPKLLDTNVVIDGRIFDVCRCGFLQGSIIVPSFVLDELQHIADSADPLRRNRGRRGLDILHQMQSKLDPPLQVLDRFKVPFAPGDGVDVRLVKLAKAMNADIVTNHFNLNKVAKLHGVRVLNVNELANVVKPLVLPGEEIHVTIVREGKEYNEGVGYLDDGTMVVVENGKKMLNEMATVSVSSVMQTVAGKMIFAQLKAGPAPAHD